MTRKSIGKPEAPFDQTLGTVVALSPEKQRRVLARKQPERLKLEDGLPGGIVRNGLKSYRRVVCAPRRKSTGRAQPPFDVHAEIVLIEQSFHDVDRRLLADGLGDRISFVLTSSALLLQLQCRECPLCAIRGLGGGWIKAGRGPDFAAFWLDQKLDEGCRRPRHGARDNNSGAVDNVQLHGRRQRTR